MKLMSEKVRTDAGGFLLCQALTVKAHTPCTDVAAWSRCMDDETPYLVCDRHNASLFPGT